VFEMDKLSKPACGYSVTGRIKTVKQPYGGYLRVPSFDCVQFDDGQQLAVTENISPGLVGLAVDYLTRFMLSKDVMKAFLVSCVGACVAEQHGEIGSEDAAKALVNGIIGLDDSSIEKACQLVSFDVWTRNIMGALVAMTTWRDIRPNATTVENIRIMVKRSLALFDTYGPIVEMGFSFEPHGYTDVVSSGDGDYLTTDTLWDFKVSKNKPKSADTLQILMYYIMGLHSGNPIFSSIDYIALFNPRLNCMYRMPVANISADILNQVESTVICYD